MDKVKDIFHAVFVKHQFWTLSIIVILVGIAVWWLSAGRLKTEYDKNNSQVTSTQQTIVQIASKPENQIFNETSHTGMKDMNAERRRDVYLAWREKEKKQRSEVLVWPEGLSNKFITAIEAKLQGRPIEELKPNTDGTDHLVFQLREEYRNEIKDLLPKLAEMINAEWNPQGAARNRRGGGVGGAEFGGGFGGGFGARPGPAEGGQAVGGGKEKIDKEYAVWWSPTDQGEIQSTHFDWSDADELPTTMEILYSMEDYWVLKALMQIIQRTNMDDESGAAPTRPELAAIREIHSIQIGNAVESNVGQIHVVAAKGRRGGAADEGGETEAAASEAPPPVEGSLEGEAGAEPTGPDPADGRYVDKAYLPIKAAKLRSAAESGNAEEAYLAVAKRMPVRMLVKMDQRKLNKFLVECGNADLMLEVKQVRINPDAPDILAGISSRGSSGGAANAFGGGARRGGAREGVAQAEEGKFPWDVMVEVYGIIYIFNPPSRKRLIDKLEADEIKKFDESIKEAAPSTAAVDAQQAGAGAEGEEESKPAADEPAPPDDAPAEDAPPADEEPAKPPMAAEGPKPEGAAVPAG